MLLYCDRKYRTLRENLESRGYRVCLILLVMRTKEYRTLRENLSVLRFEGFVVLFVLN
jgi:hypothetical protein